jgi:uncharacterized protein YjgD (DUF1641 family)
MAQVNGGKMEPSLAELDLKLDALTTQVAYLSEQARLGERARQDRAELVRDLTPVANEAFRLTVEQLEEVQEYVDLRDLLRLFKRVLRNGRNIEQLLDQLESLSDLAGTVGPLADDAFAKVVDVLSALDEKGVFAYGRRALQAANDELGRPVDSSLGGLLWQLRDPAVRRGLAIMLGVLRVVGVQASKGETASGVTGE